MTLQVGEERLTAPDKLKCGDFVLYGVVGPGRTHFAALSDGVGSHSCDWVASETACRVAHDAFVAQERPAVDRLERAVRCAHEVVNALEGRAAGATATLVLLAWTEGENVARYMSVGDFRLYRVSVDGVERLTRDDTMSVPVRINGEIVLQGGSVKFAPGLTRAVGYASLGDVEVGEVAFRNGDMLMAVTDGFHELPGFAGKVGTVYDSVDLDSAISHELEGLHRVLGRDDASLVVWRRAGTPVDNPGIYLSALDRGVDVREVGGARHLMVEVCLERVEALVARHGYEDTIGIIQFNTCGASA